MSADQTAAEQFRVDAFNHAFPIGTPVRYWTGEREGDGKNSATRTAAQILGGHTAVVWVGGEASCIALTHVEPIDQPDDDGMCSCESYDCQGECCGPGQCSCTPADVIEERRQAAGEAS